MAPKPGDKLIVKKECVCKRFLHESSNYPRDGYRQENKPEYTLKPGDTVTFISEWGNFYGYYYRVKKEDSDRSLDIEPDNFI